MTDMIKWQSALIAFVVCMCQMFTPAGAQEAGTRVHVVQRGEDIGSVAAKYGTTAAALAELNYGLDVFYAGMKINVPAKEEARPASAAPQTAAAPPQNSAAPQQAEAEHGGTANAFGFAPNAVYNDDPRRTDAELAMANGEYKDAVKLFTKIIKDNPGGAGWKCYYFRGYCNYQRGKYKSAIEDLEEAFNDVQCRGEHRETVSELLADAQSKRQEQLQNRAQTWGAIIGTTALLGAATYASVQAAKSSQAASKSANGSTFGNINTATSYKGYSAANQSGGSAVGVEFPEAFNPERVAKMSRIEFSYDENGNVMAASPGFAQSLGEMNAAIQQKTQQVSSKLMATGDPYFMAKAQSLQAVAKTHQSTTQINQQIYSTPIYLEAWADAYSSGDDVSVANESIGSARVQDDTNAERKETGENSLNSVRASTRKTSNSTSTRERTKSRNFSNDKDEEEKKLDSKQQFHSGAVSSDDYEVVKRNVTLYLRNGDDAKPFMRNKELCRKGAGYFIKVNGTYLRVGYSNWSRFNRSVLYGAQSVYFNM